MAGERKALVRSSAWSLPSRAVAFIGCAYPGRRPGLLCGALAGRGDRGSCGVDRRVCRMEYDPGGDLRDDIGDVVDHPSGSTCEQRGSAHKQCGSGHSHCGCAYEQWGSALQQFGSARMQFGSARMQCGSARTQCGSAQLTPGTGSLAASARGTLGGSRVGLSCSRFSDRRPAVPRPRASSRSRCVPVPGAAQVPSDRQPGLQTRRLPPTQDAPAA